jgi:predicted metal-dependent hydrolase
LELVAYTIVRKARLKHTYIQIKLDASVEIRTNLTTSQTFIQKLVEQKLDWIEKKQVQIQQRELLDDAEFYLFGKLCQKSDYGITSQDMQDRLYRQKSIEAILPLVDSWSEKMQLFPTHIGFRKTKTRWGSCSHKNRLSFNTNLAKMHPDFIEYVVVHELAHIKHKNHSKEFWLEVQKYLPDYKSRKKLTI